MYWLKTFLDDVLAHKARLVVVDMKELASLSKPITVPDEFALSQNYPNPFNPSCEISYGLPVGCHVKLFVYNPLGQQVVALVDQYQGPGFYTASWDGKDAYGHSQASSIYFYKIEAAGYIQFKKMVLIK